MSTDQSAVRLQQFHEDLAKRMPRMRPELIESAHPSVLLEWLESRTEARVRDELAARVAEGPMPGSVPAAVAEFLQKERTAGDGAYVHDREITIGDLRALVARIMELEAQREVAA